MLTVNKLIPQARGLAPVLTRRAPRVDLDWDVRQRSRFDATDSSGRPLGVFLPRGSVVRGGDVLVGEDGSLIVVTAAPQPVLVVTPCPDHGTPFDLMRAAYHLGNRHVALELQPDRLQLEPDHVLAGMLRQMHLTVTEAHAAFEPENGAYAAAAHAHAGHAHAGDAHAGHAHAGNAHAGNAHAGNAHAGDAHAGHAHAGPAHAGHAHEGHAHAGHAHPDHAPAGNAHEGHAQEAHAPTSAGTRPVPALVRHEQHDHGHHDHAAHVHGPGCGHDHAD